MNIIERWKNGTLTDAGDPRRVIVTPEPNCNLACEHCYFSHNKVTAPSSQTDWSQCLQFVLDNDLFLLLAGRVVTDRVIHFMKEYLSITRLQNKKAYLAVVDNGYTVFNLEPYFNEIQEFNISIDGADAQHDRQRNKTGSARVAWDAVYRLKSLGYDPVIAACTSPITIHQWTEFEKEIEQVDIRLSTGLTVEIEETRAPALFRDKFDRAKALEVLVTGIPKLIQMYDTRDVAALEQVLGKVDWKEDDLVPGLSVTLPNGVHIIYRPESILWNVEFVAHHDGRVQHLPRHGLSFENIYEKELGFWQSPAKQ